MGRAPGRISSGARRRAGPCPREQRRQAADDPAWQADYRRWRPPVEHAVAWLVHHGTRRLRHRGTIKADAWLHTRAAALNLRRLINLGLTRTNHTWHLPSQHITARVVRPTAGQPSQDLQQSSRQVLNGPGRLSPPHSARPGRRNHDHRRLSERFGNLRSVRWLPKLAPETTKRSLEHTRSRRGRRCDLRKLGVGDTGFEPVASSV
ncbi:transposase [Actinomadura verrucosospora]|uniref:transposase n=1 Tax=Actinomadura verrucosospora TaxID=46165 RepID=UPI0035EECF1B